MRLDVIIVSGARDLTPFFDWLFKPVAPLLADLKGVVTFCGYDA